MADSDPPTGGGAQDRNRTWLTRNVKALAAVSLAQDAASELMYPLLPVLLTTTLGAPAAVVGLVEGLAEGFSAAFKYLSGRWSDRFGRKPAVATGYSLAALGKVIIAAATIWPTVLVGRVVDRVGKGIRGAPRDALLADDVAPSDLGKVYGFHRAADTLGAVVGPTIGALVLAWTGGDVQAALWFAVIPAVISVGLVALTRETPRVRAPRAVPQASEYRGRTMGANLPPKPMKLPPRVRLLATVLAVFALVNFPDALVLLRISELGYSTSELVASYALFNAANAAIAFPAGALSDRWPRHRVYALGLACFAVGYLGLGLVDGGPAAAMLLVVYGGFAGITDGVGKAWISAMAPVEVRGHAQGLFQALSGVGILVAGLWAGLAWEVGTGAGVVPLVISGSVAAVAGIALWLFGPALEPGEPATTALGAGT